MAEASATEPARAAAIPIARLAVATGAGRMVRRDRSLLHLPEGAPADFVARFHRCAHDELADDLTGQILDGPDEVPPFAFIEWSGPDEASRIQVIVRGDVELASDVNSMPMLSGAGSPTWVEHRVPRIPDLARFWCGAPVDADTDLSNGVVFAGGFELQLALRVATSPVSEPQQPSTPRQPKPPMPPEGHSAADSQGRLARIANLAAAAGGDVVEQPSARPVPQRHEETLPESALTAEPEPQRGTIDPVRYEIELADGSRHGVVETTALGRRPDGDAAQQPDAAVIALDAPASVSRTHVCLTVSDTRLFATDCSSSRGTVVVRSGERSPVSLEPWVPVEVGNGDRLYLGGMETCLTVHHR